jgi:phage FluMu protein Com
MHEFRITGDGIGSVEYVVLKCPSCGRIQRFMHRQECFGKVPKNAGCKQCQKAIPIEENCLDNDPLPMETGEKLYSYIKGVWVPAQIRKIEYTADYTTADKIK